MSEESIFITLPDYDKEVFSKWGIASPTSKMPNCPVCEEDELSMTGPDHAFCNKCNAKIERITTP